MFNIEELIRLTRLDKKTLIERALKLNEETGEVSEAVLSYMDTSGCGYKNKTSVDVIEESIDVMMIAASIIIDASENGLDLDLIQSIYNDKINKWKSKIGVKGE